MSKHFPRIRGLERKAAAEPLPQLVHAMIVFDRSTGGARMSIVDGGGTLGEIANVLLMLRDQTVAEIVRQSAKADPALAQPAIAAPANPGVLTPSGAGADRGPG